MRHLDAHGVPVKAVEGVEEARGWLHPMMDTAIERLPCWP
jgi:hypothetical protein